MSTEIAWSKEPVKRLSELPSIENPSFAGPPSYLGTPNFGQLRQEVREFAYTLWERYGWDAETCWTRAESAIFCGFENVGLGSIGYRVYVREDEEPYWNHDGPAFQVKVITPEFPVQFQMVTGGEEPQRHGCDPVTLCSAMKRVEERPGCPDTL